MNVMRKVEIVSLFFLIIAVGVLILTLQMDYGNARKWMLMLFVALLVLAIDPKLFLRKKQKPKETDVSEDNRSGKIFLASAIPVEKNTLNFSDAYLTFWGKEYDDYFFIHYVDGKADEIYIGDAYFLECLEYDDLEEYGMLDGLLSSADNGEIEDFCTISAEDFKSVRTHYQDMLVNLSQTKSPDQILQEPVNRVGKAIVFVLLAIVFVCICVALSMLPFETEIDGGTYIGIFFLFCLILLVATFLYFLPETWLERRIKWFMGSVKLNMESIGYGKNKLYYAEDFVNRIFLEYNPLKKQMTFTKHIQVPLNNAKQKYEQRKGLFTDWLTDKPFIEQSYMSEMNSLGVCYFTFTVPKTDATKTFMKELREWSLQPAFDASKVCECFKFKEAEGTFYVKYQSCGIDMLVYVQNSGKTEIFDPKVNTLQDKDLSAEIKRFYVDFENYYAQRINDEQKIKLSDIPICKNTP
jgi:hypothetical protein